MNDSRINIHAKYLQGLLPFIQYSKVKGAYAGMREFLEYLNTWREEEISFRSRVPFRLDARRRRRVNTVQESRKRYEQVPPPFTHNAVESYDIVAWRREGEKYPFHETDRIFEFDREISPAPPPRTCSRVSEIESISPQNHFQKWPRPPGFRQF